MRRLGRVVAGAATTSADHVASVVVIKLWCSGWVHDETVSDCRDFCRFDAGRNEPNGMTAIVRQTDGKNKNTTKVRAKIQISFKLQSAIAGICSLEKDSHSQARFLTYVFQPAADYTHPSSVSRVMQESFSFLFGRVEYLRC